jgi:hypothetical protein
MKKFFVSLLFLVQVGSNLWVTRLHVIGVEKNKYAEDGCVTTIFVTSGTDMGHVSYIFSDWDISKVLEALNNGETK